MNHTKLTPRLLAPFSVAILSLSAVQVSADVLAEYQFVTSGAATTLAADVSGSDTTWSFTGTSVSFGGGNQSAFARADALPTSIDETRFLTFTLTAAEGKFLNLSSFSFDFGANAGGAGGNTTFSAEIRTDVGAVAFDTPLVVSPPSGTTATHTIPGPSTALAYTNYTVDLSGAEFQGLESISFRALVATSLVSTNRFLRFDNLSIEGTVVSSAIPEPSTAALLIGVGALGLVGCKRRRIQ